MPTCRGRWPHEFTNKTAILPADLCGRWLLLVSLILAAVCRPGLTDSLGNEGSFDFPMSLLSFYFLSGDVLPQLFQYCPESCIEQHCACLASAPYNFSVQQMSLWCGMHDWGTIFQRLVMFQWLDPTKLTYVP